MSSILRSKTLRAGALLPMCVLKFLDTRMTHSHRVLPLLLAGVIHGKQPFPFGASTARDAIGTRQVTEQARDTSSMSQGAPPRVSQIWESWR